MRAAFFVVVMLATFTCYAQDYTQRGFLETQGAFYPKKAPNDSAHAVGEVLLRHESFYTPLNSLQFAGGLDFRVDTHRQVERGLELSGLDREVQRPAAAVRRLSATYHKGPTTFEVGKQYIRWGKTDIVTPTDRFAPRDYLTVVDNDFLAVVAARLNFEKGRNTVEAVFSPTFTPSRIPLIDQRWAPQPALAPPVKLHDAGAVFPGGPQTGVRWNHAGAIEYEVSFYEGFNNLPSFNTTPRFTPSGIDVGIQRFYPKMIMAGGDIAIPLRWLTVKTEAGHFSTTDNRADEYALYVFQLERQAGEWFFLGGYAGESITRHGTLPAEFAPDRGFSKTILGRGGYTIDANRNIAFEMAVRQNGNGAWVRGEYSQSFGQHWRATVNLTFIGGNDSDFLGQYHQNSHATLILRYSF
jgi:hypothetical protein